MEQEGKVLNTMEQGQEDKVLNTRWNKKIKIDQDKVLNTRWNKKIEVLNKM